MACNVFPADRRAVKSMVDKDVVRDMDMGRPFALDDRFPCIEGTMTNTPMLSRIQVEARPVMLIQTNIRVTNVPFRGEARPLVTSMDEGTGYVSAFQMKSKSEPAKLLKRQVSCVEREVRMYG